MEKRGPKVYFLSEEELNCEKGVLMEIWTQVSLAGEGELLSFCPDGKGNTVHPYIYVRQRMEVVNQPPPSAWKESTLWRLSSLGGSQDVLVFLFSLRSRASFSRLKHYVEQLQERCTRGQGPLVAAVGMSDSGAYKTREVTGKEILHLYNSTYPLLYQQVSKLEDSIQIMKAIHATLPRIKIPVSQYGTPCCQ
ncbi:hypothetical protein NMY22_g5473 [Coprinellus aureogranulatus]|nr:hypothetical protein NMY22_g5473 [Coprinellus aureogranulatus]